jgi:hypothetical protein
MSNNTGMGSLIIKRPRASRFRPHELSLRVDSVAEIRIGIFGDFFRRGRVGLQPPEQAASNDRIRVPLVFRLPVVHY